MSVNTDTYLYAVCCTWSAEENAAAVFGSPV